MRWNCPHCGTTLTVSDDKVGENWSFSRCYSCQGFALVRKSQVSIIKVHQPPSGEQYIVTTHQQEQASATHSQTHHDARPAARPVVRPVVRQPAALPPPIEVAPVMHQAPSMHMAVPLAAPTAPSPTKTQMFTISDGTGAETITVAATTSSPRRKMPAALVPIGIGLAGAIAISSGVYLYQQGQALFQLAQKPIAAESPTEMQVARLQAPPSLDRIPQSAMAPERVTEIRSLPKIERIDPPEVRPAAPIAITKRVEEKREESDDTPAIEPRPTAVQVKNSYANLRAGPSLEHPIVGVAEPGTIYLIKTWEGRWFNIVPEDPAQAALQKKSMWVRNDLVETLVSTN
ncbi:MAG: MJ0042-type zinc finger domain-containing protein [Bacteriovoracia bacterium]